MGNKHRGIGFGVFLLTLGLLWILITAGIVTWSVVDALFVLWPLILVIIGVNVIFRRNGLVRVFAWVVFLTVVISYGYFFIDRGQPAKEYVAAEGQKIERTAQTTEAELSIALGGAGIDLDSDLSDTGSLLEYNLQNGNGTNLSSELTDDNTKARISFEKRRYDITDIKTANDRRNSFHLNKDVVWGLRVDTGAINGDFDMSTLKVRNLDLNIGASNAKLIMGSYNTKLNINAGASKIEIVLPRDTGMKVKIDGGLNSDNLQNDGWEKRDDGWYYSPGCDSKDFVIEADGSMGLVNLTVNEAG